MREPQQQGGGQPLSDQKTNLKMDIPNTGCRPAFLTIKLWLPQGIN
jgi:hypothetical protein